MSKLSKIIRNYLEKQSNATDSVKALSTDSRSINEGDLFIPLIGENFDGHNFILNSLKNAAYALSQKPLEEFDCDSELKKRIIKVENTLDAYHEIASAYRDAIDPIVIAITGSSGKTTTKELMHLVLEEKYKVHYSKANFNNEIGVPQTIVEMPEDTEVLILEMGMRGLGEIELLSKTAKPNLALITNIGTAHIERLGSRENIKKAKLEIIAGLKETLFVDSNLYKELKLDDIELVEFDYELRFEVEALMSKGLYADLNAVYKVANHLGLNDEQIKKGFAKYQPGPGRGQLIESESGDLFIDETYNANPEAVLNSVEAMLSQFPDDHKIVVLGDIKESTPEIIEDCFQKIEAMAEIDLLDMRGKPVEEISQLIKDIKSDKRKVILLKASRAHGLEKVLESLSVCHN